MICLCYTCFFAWLFERHPAFEEERADVPNNDNNKIANITVYVSREYVSVNTSHSE